MENKVSANKKVQEIDLKKQLNQNIEIEEPI